jgi:beta-glucosidase
VESPLEAITRLNTGGAVHYAPGIDGVAGKYDAKLVDDAKAVASAADAVVFILGGDWSTEHEGMDRKDIKLPGAQSMMVAAVVASMNTAAAAVGETAAREAAAVKPVVAVMVHGGSMDIEDVAAHSHAVLDAFYPGMHGARAIAEALLGDVNPGQYLPSHSPVIAARCRTHTRMMRFDTLVYGVPSVCAVWK